MEHRPIYHSAFKMMLRRIFFEAHAKTPNSQALQDASGVLAAMALFKGRDFPTFKRVAEAESKVYLDLANSDWEVVEIDERGWRGVPNSMIPIKFRRARGMLPLPHPVKAGSIDELRRFVNVADQDWPLLLGWLVGTMNPRGPYPILVLHGESRAPPSRLLPGLYAVS